MTSWSRRRRCSGGCAICRPGSGCTFLLALGMYPQLGYARVWAKLTAGLTDLPVPRPSEKALSDALLNGTLDYYADVGT